ncbi:MAG: CFI-box-CTERM domain-containing protein [Halobacteriota archaeon]
MGYRKQAIIYLKDGRKMEYKDVYVKDRGGGLEISKYSNYKDSEYVPYSNIDITKCMKEDAGESGCFISTALYQASKDPSKELFLLRSFRDNVMNKNKMGRILVRYYYKIAPPIADYLCNARLMGHIIKALFIDSSVRLIEKRNKIEQKYGAMARMYSLMIVIIYILALFISFISYKMCIKRKE